MVTEIGQQRRAAVFAGVPTNGSSPGHDIGLRRRLTRGNCEVSRLTHQRREKSGDGIGAGEARTPDLRIANTRAQHSRSFQFVLYYPIFNNLSRFLRFVLRPMFSNIPAKSRHDYTGITHTWMGANTTERNA